MMNGMMTQIDPKYHANGNMTVMPNPDDPTQALAATYDTWNRMVKLSDISTGVPVTVAEYEYDATARRIEKVDKTGTSDVTYDYYYSAAWQIVQVDVDSGTGFQPVEQFVWGIRYVDELIARDRDTDDNGTLDERHYVLQDANFNVTAIVERNETRTQLEFLRRLRRLECCVSTQLSSGRSDLSSRSKRRELAALHTDPQQFQNHLDCGGLTPPSPFGRGCHDLS